MEYILHYEAHFRAFMERQLRLESEEHIKANCKKLAHNERRIAELKRLFIRIYEDNANGRLNDERFDMLSQSYETEQKQLATEIVDLQKKIGVQVKQNEGLDIFIRKAKKHIGITDIDAYKLHELVSAIYVDEPDKSSGKRKQQIHIKYDGVGFIPLDKLMQEETA